MNTRAHTMLLPVLLVSWQCLFGAGTNELQRIPNDGTTDATAAIQAVLDSGQCTLAFPPGDYLIGTIRVPEKTHLRFAAGAAVRINPEKITAMPMRSGPGDGRVKPIKVLWNVVGDDVLIEGMDVDFRLADGRQATSHELNAVIGAIGASDLEFTRLRAVRSPARQLLPLEKRRGGGGRYAPGSKKDGGAPSLVLAESCTNVVLSSSLAEHIGSMIEAVSCADVTVRGNRATSCLTITSFHGGSQWLRHHDNWSRDVRHQCVWRGSNANDMRSVPVGDPRRGTANQVARGVLPGDPGYKPGTTGAFDVLVQNNYAEYGRTAAWGSKGRQVIFQGNIARFMQDYSFGSEGGENVVFANNISINAKTCGLACYYWSEKVVMSGNMVLVQDEPWDPHWSWLATQDLYQGGLVRLHAIGHPERKSGTGGAIITGNLLSSSLTNRTRRVGIEMGRDVMISGNKIVNGCVTAKHGSGQVSVVGNEFIQTLPSPATAVRFPGAMEHGVVRDNTFRRVPAAVTEATAAAISVDAWADRRPSIGPRVVEGNLITGWPVAITARSLSKKESARDAFIIKDNLVDGAVDLWTGHGRCGHLESGNVDTVTLRPAAVNVREGEEPLPAKAEAAPAAAPEPTDEEIESET